MHNVICIAPSAPPADVVFQVISSSSIQVTWNEVPLEDRNGIITMYQVEYNQTTFDSITNKTVNTSDLSVTLTNLEEYTEYFIRVRAYTEVDKGPGPYSNVTVATTDQDSKYSIVRCGCSFHFVLCIFQVQIHLHRA